MQFADVQPECCRSFQMKWPKSVFATVLLGLSVSLDHLLGSTLLDNILSRLGFCCSYDEISQFKQSVVQSDDELSPFACAESFTQFAADNVDHNVWTIYGADTFHGMRIISMSPHNSLSIQHFGDVAIRRLLRCTATDIVQKRGIPLLSYDVPQKSVLSVVSFKSHQLLQHKALYSGHCCCFSTRPSTFTTYIRQLLSSQQETIVSKWLADLY